MPLRMFRAALMDDTAINGTLPHTVMLCLNRGIERLLTIAKVATMSSLDDMAAIYQHLAQSFARQRDRLVEAEGRALMVIHRALSAIDTQRLWPA